MSFPFGMALHGGAGVILRREMTPAAEAAFRSALAEALAAGHGVLAGGGASLDAVVAAIRHLEDCPLFNAGRGAVLNSEGFCELDAALMEGRTRAAGAVAGVRRIRNPISLARDVMEKSPHVLLTGAGAEAFAWSVGHEPAPEAYFLTEHRRGQLERARRREERLAATPPSPAPGPRALATVDDNDDVRNWKFGTVGAVALDRHGDLAAGTSTGGMTNKRYGRVGDSPIVGAGTYADNATCAVSCTGHGEFFIRNVVGHDIAARMAYGGRDLETAVRETLHRVGEHGGRGGLIAIDRQGRVTTQLNTPGMYRAWRSGAGELRIELYGGPGGD